MVMELHGGPTQPLPRFYAAAVALDGFKVHPWSDDIDAPAKRRKRRAVKRARTRRSAKFTHADVARAVRGAQKAELPIAAVRIEQDGAIVIIRGEPHSVTQSSKFTDWDDDL
jgi:hypothetical protein